MGRLFGNFSSTPTFLPTAKSALLQLEYESEDGRSDKGLILALGIVIGTLLACLAFCVPIVCKDSRNIRSRDNSRKKSSSTKDENLLLYERALREMDEEFYADLRKDDKTRDERKNDKKRTKKRKADVDHHIERLALQERIENIHAESLRKAGSKLEYDTVF